MNIYQDVDAVSKQRLNQRCKSHGCLRPRLLPAFHLDFFDASDLLLAQAAFIFRLMAFFSAAVLALRLEGVGVDLLALAAGVSRFDAQYAFILAEWALR
jgi:hypothetical protein